MDSGNLSYLLQRLLESDSLTFVNSFSCRTICITCEGITAPTGKLLGQVHTVVKL